MTERVKGYLNISESVLSDATGDVVIGAPILLHHEYPILVFEFAPGGLSGENIDKFILEYQAHQAGAWISRFTAWADGGDIIDVSAALESLGGDLKGTAIVRCGPVYAVRFTTSWNGASPPAAPRTLTVKGAASRWI